MSANRTRKTKKKRSDIATSRPVVAIERHGNVTYESMSEVMDVYGISSISTLTRMIENAQVWKGDGYTIFDWVLEPS